MSSKEFGLMSVEDEERRLLPQPGRHGQPAPVPEGEGVRRGALVHVQGDPLAAPDGECHIIDGMQLEAFTTSGGLGTMGYGLPAAVGVQAAHLAETAGELLLELLRTQPGCLGQVVPAAG